VDHAFDRHWSAKIEYLYLDFRSFEYLGLPSDPASNSFWKIDVTSREHVVRLGLNYKFDWGGPVIAKY
jgi:outer membrane immunogenic protein